MCNYEYAEPATVLNSTRRRARKQHLCCECGRAIEPGESYSFEVTLFEGRVRAYKTCAHCCTLAGWLSENCDGWVYTQIVEECEEHAREYPLGWPFARAVVAAGQQWRRRDGTLRPVPDASKFGSVGHA